MEERTKRKRGLGISFTMVPSWLVSYGVWASLTGSEKAVLVVLAKRANNNTHVCMPTHDTIAKEAGVSLRSISEITQRLAGASAIKKWRRWSRVTYEVLFKPPPWLAETGISWDVRNKVPKKPESYPKDARTGRFLSTNPGDVASENPGPLPSEEPSTCLKSAVTKSLVEESVQPFQEAANP